MTGSGRRCRKAETIEQCGWLKDRYGLFWQIAPTVLGEMVKDSDRARAKRVAEAMLKMIKLDIEGLKKAYEGRQRLRANLISSRPPFRTFPPLGRSAARTMPRRCSVRRCRRLQQRVPAS